LKAFDHTDVKKPDLYDSDLPADRLELYLSRDVVAIDTETRGLVIPRDRLCLVQIGDESGNISLVKYTGAPTPNLKKLLESESTIKLFHFARFDVAVLKHYLDCDVKPIWCTKIASKLVRTYTDRHSLKDLVKEFMSIELDKQDQTSDWAKDTLSSSQIQYAANDVRYLIPIYRQLKLILARENLSELCESVIAFLPTLAVLDLQGRKDIFEH
jgi:ribonuclease D